MSRFLRLSSLALLCAAHGALAQAPADVRACQGELARLQVMQHPQVREALHKRGATLEDVFLQIDALAAMDNADAQYAIARIQQHGRCAQQNVLGALAYMTRAAENGLRAAQQALAVSYHLGKNAPGTDALDIPPDSMRAYMWYLVLGDEVGASQVRRRLTQAEISEAEELAREQLAKQAKARASAPK